MDKVESFPDAHVAVARRLRWVMIRDIFVAYGLSVTIVGLGIAVGLAWSAEDDQRSPDRTPQSGNRFRDTLAQWDGQWYQKIAREGYSYDPDCASAVAFFPLYPSLGAAIAFATRLPTDVALLVIAHAFAICALWMFRIYAAERVRDRGKDEEIEHPLGTSDSVIQRGREFADYSFLAVLSLALFPTSFFLLMEYSESLFLSLVLIVMWGIRRRWAVGWLVFLVGLATAARLVGIALIPPLLWYVWRSAPSWRIGLQRALYGLPLSVWGLMLYMAFQFLAFDTPLAFAQTQDHWRMRPAIPQTERLLALASWEPLWSVYLPSWPTYWGRIDTCPWALASLQAANPVLFAGAVVAALVGCAKRWLTLEEVMLSGGLLLIPYVSKGYEMCMASQGRFVLVVFPVFLVFAELLARMRRTWRFGVLVASAIFLFTYACMWAKGYLLI